MKYALVTGASGGIGWELAKQFAAAGHPVALTARSEDKLRERTEQLQKEYGVSVQMIPADLTAEGGPRGLFDRTREMGIGVDVLVNNAGFGDYGLFIDSDWSRQRDMIALNIAALTELTYLFAGEMRRQGGGRILNVASVAAMGAGPYMSVYYATKAYVLSFSQAMTEELREFGITVTALCPGPTDTGFEAAARMENCNLFKSVRVEGPEKVAERGYKAVMKGRPVKFCGFTVHWMSLASRAAPLWLNRKFAARTNGRPPELGKKAK